MQLSGVSFLRAKENDSNNCSSCIVLYFCTCAKQRLEDMVNQVNVLPQFGDNYLSTGLLCLFPCSSSDDLWLPIKLLVGN